MTDLSEHNLRVVLAASPIPLIVSRLSDGRVIHVNEAVSSIIDLAPEDMIGRPTVDFYADPSERDEIIRALREKGALHNVQFRVKAAGGDIRWVLGTLVITRADDEDIIVAGLYDVTAQKRAEDALAAEKEFVDAVLATAGALVVVLDRRGHIVRFNRACETTTGYTFEEVANRPFWEIFLLPEEVAGVRTIFDSLTAGHFPNTWENHWVTKSGEKRLVAWSNSALTRDGVVDHVIATGIDITERRQAEEALRESDEIFHQLVDTINQVYWMRDLGSGKPLFTSSAFEDIWGVPPDETVDIEDLAEHIHPDDRRVFLERIRELVAHPERTEEEFRIIRPDGTVRWIRSRTFPIADEAGNVYRLCGTNEDITERKQAEQDLASSEARFRGIVENANDIIFTLDADDAVTYLSPNFNGFTGIEESDALGKPFADLVHPGDRAAWSEFAAGVRAQGRRSGQEFRLEDRRAPNENDRWRWYGINSSRDANGIVGIAHDVTDRRRLLERLQDANRELQTAQAQLVQSEKMASLGNLVAGIAHEINTPTGAISSMHDTLVRAIERLRATVGDCLSAEAAEEARLPRLFQAVDDANHVIKTGTERVREIVRGLRSFARLDEAEVKDADVHGCIENSLTLLHHELKNRIDIVREFGNLPPIICYPSRLNQVFLNILVNAAQAIEGEGRITITTRSLDDRVEIRIADTGPGIPADALARIFDPGYTTKGVGIGTGLGLSICYQIIQDHKGDIRAENGPEGGAVFVVTLPIAWDAPT